MKSLCSSKILRYWVRASHDPSDSRISSFFFTELNGNKLELVSKSYDEIWENFKQIAKDEFRSGDKDQITEEDKRGGEIYFLTIHWPGHEKSYTTCDFVELVPVHETE